MKLPKDLERFLKMGRQLEYDYSRAEPGKVVLNRLEDLKVENIWVMPRSLPEYKKDPNMGKMGYYSVPAVSLVAKAQGYRPEFILLWLPNEKMYGAWDSYHGVLSVFPGVTWGRIVSDPVPYLNAQWDLDPSFTKVFIPYGKYSFIAGLPPAVKDRRKKRVRIALAVVLVILAFLILGIIC